MRGTARPESRDHFRAHTSAAPLKLAGFWGNAVFRRHFRAHTSAAPLKRCRLVLCHQGAPLISALTERGPIEAQNCVTRWRQLNEFPRSHERGPIEATGATTRTSAGRSPFPRSHERGPIEARRSSVIAIFWPLDFRAHTSAAPLKPLWKLGTAVYVASNFRAHTSAAPLKQWRHRPLTRDADRLFPRSTERGPIEA